MSKQNVQYEGVTGHGVGIMSAEIELDHAMMTDSGSTTGTYDWTNPIPPYSLRLGCVVETLETYSAACTVAVGITAAANEWTSATTGTCTTLGYKHVFPYGAATIITGQENTAAESVHITLTVADWTLITTGRIKVKVFFLATQVS
ncbi:MAG: hypothetical protein MUP81_04160 [Dehalococcoidia bacterium]|nr:hypothetical protein [Dehalococcoidia bacterium]